jgi:hypothetical protein
LARTPVRVPAAQNGPPVHRRGHPRHAGYPSRRANSAESRGPEFAARLVKIALEGDDSEALRAIEALNSRVLGKPKETVQQEIVAEDLQAVRDMTKEERDQLYIQLMQADGLDL